LMTGLADWWIGGADKKAGMDRGLAPSIEKRREVPFMVPQLGEAEASAAADAVGSGWVTQGPRVKEFEAAFAELVGARHACAVANCTCALHLALLAAGVRPGDVVLTTSHSYIATANAVRYCGAEPVFVDIDPGTYNLDLQAVARSLSEDFDERSGELFFRDVDRLRTPHSPLAHMPQAEGRLAAMEVVHQVGMPADLPRLLPLAREHGIPVVEDAAPALGSRISLDEGATWEPVGRPHGQSACFSFHPRKLITTGDGGMVTTNDPEVDRQVRLLRQHGMNVPDLARHEAGKVIIEEYVATGFNYRLTDIQAAVGLEQLKRLADIVEARHELAALYFQGLEGIRGLELPAEEPPFARTTWQSFVIKLAPDRRDAIMQSLLERGVHARRGTMAAHLEPPYRDAWPLGSLPHTEEVSLGGVTLPLFPSMTASDLRYVCLCLREALQS